MTKGAKISTGIVSFLLVGGLITASALVINNLIKDGAGTTTKDEKALIIGVEKLHDDLPVALSFRLINGEHTLIDQTFMSNDQFMVARTGQDEDLVFHDFTDTIAPYIGDSLFYWLNSEDGWRDHKIILNTTCLNGQIRSADFYVTDAGIYWISVAERNGEDPFATSYAAIYREKVFEDYI